MTEIAAPLPVQPFPRAAAPATAPPAAEAEADSPADVRRSRVRRFASALADTHRAAVPF